jgi:hypothetical protein
MSQCDIEIFHDYEKAKKEVKRISKKLREITSFEMDKILDEAESYPEEEQLNYFLKESAIVINSILRILSEVVSFSSSKFHSQLDKENYEKSFFETTWPLLRKYMEQHSRIIKEVNYG